MKITGQIDYDQAPGFRERLLGLLHGGVTRMVVDMSEVDYMDSAGMATLVEMLNKVEGESGEFVIAGLPESMREIFRITRLDERFRFAEDVGIAVEGMRNRRDGGA